MSGIVERMRRAAQPASRAAAFTLVLLAAACTTPAPRVATIARPAPPPTAAVSQPPLLPTATIAQNRVALLVPLSGTNGAVGQSIANAASMALLDAGSARINLRVYDTANGADAAAAKAIGEGAKLFLGPLLAGDVRAVQAQAAANGVPVLSFSNDAALAGDGTYVLGFQPGQSIARVVAYARGRGVERFAALIPAGVYGQRAASAFLRAVEAEGGKVVAVANYTRAPAKMLAAVRQVTDYDKRLAKAAATPALRPDGTVAPVTSRLPPVGFQALLIADAGPVAAAFGPALAQYGAGPGSVLILGTELWNNDSGVRNAKGLDGAVFASVADARFQQLATRYRAKFGFAPSRLASFGYDAVLLVNSLADRWSLGTAFPRALLNNPDGFTGVDGVFRFTGSGIADRGLEVQRISGGTIGTVAAAPRVLRPGG